VTNRKTWQVSRRRLLVLALGLATIAAGLSAAEVRYSWDEPLLWLPDLLVGWAVAACGLIAIWQRSSGTGILLIGTGLTWFMETSRLSIRRWPGGLPRRLFTAAC
jgi:hypothetical protein